VDEQDKPKRKQDRRVDYSVRLAEHLARNRVAPERTEALMTARAIALAGLPKRRTTKRDLVRTLRLGQDLWLRVEYTTTSKGTLPYGEDRFVVAGLQHLALKQGSPVVRFEEVGQLLEMFGVPRSNQSYLLLRQRFERLEGLRIHLYFSETEEGLDEPRKGENMGFIAKYELPTRKELLSKKIVQLPLPELGSNWEGIRCGVRLDEGFWKHLQQERERLLVPLDLMREFVNQPTGWDYALFLVYRCTRAKQPSSIAHEVLMSLFKDAATERDSETIKRLLKYHEQIMRATNGNLQAELRRAGRFPTDPKKGGRPKERWELVVGESEPVVYSGKKDDPDPEGMNPSLPE
jgi:hypothetical protein